MALELSSICRQIRHGGVVATETTNNRVNKMQNVLENKIDEYFPTKTVKLSNKDKLWIDN